MKNSTTVRGGIILSAAAAVSCLAGEYAYAYPEISIRSLAISSPSLTLVDTRSYRHCHNRPTGIYVSCYTKEPGEHEAQAPRQRYGDSRGAIDNAESHHHHVRHRSFRW
jgi:hypothetical protein